MMAPIFSGGTAGREVLFSEIQKQSRRDEAPTFRAVRNDRYRLTMETTTRTACELFDLEQDPDELQNLVSDPGYSKVQEELAEQLPSTVAAA